MFNYKSLLFNYDKLMATIYPDSVYTTWKSTETQYLCLTLQTAPFFLIGVRVFSLQIVVYLLQEERQHHYYQYKPNYIHVSINMQSKQ